MPTVIPIQPLAAPRLPLRVLRRGDQALVLDPGSLRMAQLDAADLQGETLSHAAIYPGTHAELNADSDLAASLHESLLSRRAAPRATGRLAPSLLIVKITSFCPLRCTYCYDYEETAPQDLELDTLKSVIDEFLALCEPHATLLFHGGEPLAKFPLVEAATLHARARADALGKQLTLQIQTSGAVINERIAAFLDEQAFSIGLSLDGPAEVNDVIRIMPDGRGSLPIVQRQLARFPELFRRRSAVLTTVTRLNVRQLPAIVRDFKAQGFRAIDFSLFSTMGRGQCQTGLSLQADDYVAALREIVADAEAGRLDGFHVSTLLRLLDKLLLPESRHHCRPTDGPCGAGHGVVNLQADGAVTGCDLLRGPEHVLGRAGQLPLAEMLDGPRAAQLRGRYDGLLQCHRCTWKRACGGTCGASSPGHHELDAMECEAMQALFEMLAWRLHEGDGLLNYYLRHRERLIVSPEAQDAVHHAVA